MIHAVGDHKCAVCVFVCLFVLSYFQDDAYTALKDISKECTTQNGNVMEKLLLLEGTYFNQTLKLVQQLGDKHAVRRQAYLFLLLV